MSRKIIILIALIFIIILVGAFIFFWSEFRGRKEPLSPPVDFHEPATGPENVKPPTTPPPGQPATPQNNKPKD
jgi:flagellar basal body-associated protein FliL